MRDTPSDAEDVVKGSTQLDREVVASGPDRFLETTGPDLHFGTELRCLPDELTSRSANGDVPWADWHRGRDADLLRQIAAGGGLVSNSGASTLINPRAWRPQIERVYISLSSFDAGLYGAGLLRLMLAERSFKNRPKDPNLTERCEVRTSKRPKGVVPRGADGKKTDTKLPGPLAVRAGLTPWMVYVLNKKRGDAELLTVKKCNQPRSKRQRPNQYEFPDDLLSEVERHIHSGKFRLSAEIPVATLILRKFHLARGFAEFSRNDLRTSGLKSLAWADKGLKRLLSQYDGDGRCVKRGIFVAIGYGRVTLPEVTEEGHFNAIDGSKIWVAPET
ncbi:hypothetical protein [Hyphomicrobium facile]|uniref:Uncharacterized protein n=1 Tax=Hyphomicrobium facile TaxID=51670 RepID=A0A1I7NDY6_9HYPH|nr:hypothetical protein [Hyphomicrobium facile]SFV32895.1 hypothetical protein SAMN04488557_1764 [Hyphomicrobium facile]